MEFISVIIIIIIVILILAFIKFLFTNYVTSRVLCAISVIWAIVNIWTNPEEILSSLILTTVSWLFFIGPTVFDVEWDGTWDITPTSDGWKASPSMTGGFISNAIISFLVSCIPLFFGTDPLTLTVIPAIILLLDAISFIGMLRR